MNQGVSSVPGVRQWVSSRNVGRKFFVVLLLDMLAQRFMKFTSTENFSFELKSIDEAMKSSDANKLLNTNVFYEGIKEANSLFATDSPPALSSVYPIAQTALMGVSTFT